MNSAITTSNLPEYYTNPANGLTYKLHSDYYLPLLSVGNTPSMKYLQENQPILFNRLIVA